jgi:hypothetical protein
MKVIKKEMPLFLMWGEVTEVTGKWSRALRPGDARKLELSVCITHASATFARLSSYLLPSSPHRQASSWRCSSLWFTHQVSFFVVIASTTLQPNRWSWWRYATASLNEVCNWSRRYVIMVHEVCDDDHITYLLDHKYSFGWSHFEK